jgi:hypothetical protein
MTERLMVASRPPTIAQLRAKPRGRPREDRPPARGSGAWLSDAACERRIASDRMRALLVRQRLSAIWSQRARSWARWVLLWLLGFRYPEPKAALWPGSGWRAPYDWGSCAGPPDGENLRAHPSNGPPAAAAAARTAAAAARSARWSAPMSP